MTSRTHSGTGQRRVFIARAVSAVAVLALTLILFPPASLASSRQLYAFGENYYGQLGNTANNGNNNPNPVLSPVTLPGASGDVSEAAAGLHSMAITSTGQLYAFGDNASEQLGIAANAGTSAANPTPTLVALPGATGVVSHVSAAYDHTLAVTTTGQLYAFGNNHEGQLGNASGNGTDAPHAPTLVTLPGATGPVVQAAAGDYFSLALTSTGQLYAFGENSSGQLGKAANITANPTPTLVALPGATGQIVRVSAGTAHVLALTSTGQLYAFGANYEGQLGTSTNSGTTTPNPTPIKVVLPGASGPVSQIAAGDSHSLALTSTGQLFAFGWNMSGQLGSTANNGTYNPNPTPTLVALPGEIGTVTALAAGGAHTLAVTSGGQLYAFGANKYGQLGLATNAGTFNANPTPALVPLPAGYAAVDVAQGYAAEHSLVLLAARPQPTPVPPATVTPVTPSLSSLRVSPARFAAGGRELRGRCVKPTHANRAHKQCRRAVKLRITYKLNVGGIVVFTLARQSHGHRLIALRGFMTKAGAAGTNSFVWNGAIGGRRLGPGTYGLFATPRGGAPRRAKFTIVG
jgi:alpha-tubulin suppressor-like RCC1 family protein